MSEETKGNEQLNGAKPPLPKVVDMEKKKGEVVTADMGKQVEELKTHIHTVINDLENLVKFKGVEPLAEKVNGVINFLNIKYNYLFTMDKHIETEGKSAQDRLKKQYEDQLKVWDTNFNKPIEKIKI